MKALTQPFPDPETLTQQTHIEGSIDVIIQAGRHEGARGITEFYLPGTGEAATRTRLVAE